VCYGEPNKQIGRRLRMTEGTVKVRGRHIMRKWAATNRTQMAVYASSDYLTGQ
jgi:DNA-binding NarL/FixJ family response regulator